MRRYLFLSGIDYPLLGVRRPFAAGNGHEPDPIQVLPVRDRVRNDVLKVTVFSSLHVARYSTTVPCPYRSTTREHNDEQTG